jgi:NADH:ubiquinone reductase (H+-translocating)
VAPRVVILGAGFAGCYVARELARTGVAADTTLIDPRNYMLYTPLLPEAASGTVEPRHVVVPVRMMCRGARLLLGRATAIDWEARCVTGESPEGQPLSVDFDHVVVALGAVSRSLPIPGLDEHAIGFKTVAEAIELRDTVLEHLELASGTRDDARRDRLLTFVFVGGGYAGVEALAELEDLVRDAMRWYPALADARQRWVLVDVAPRLLPQLSGRLGSYAMRQLRDRGVEIRLETGVASADDEGVTLTDGTRIPTATLVWTAGVRPHPLVSRLGLDVDDQGRIRVDACLRAIGRTDAWALGDAAAVPNRATPGETDPPTSQHALRQARALARNLAAVLRGEAPRPYAYRMLGQVATLGRRKGVAEVFGLPLSGFAGWWVTRTYHLYQLPLPSRKLRVVADWTVDLAFPRDIVELGVRSRASRSLADPG